MYQNLDPNAGPSYPIIVFLSLVRRTFAVMPFAKELPFM